MISVGTRIPFSISYSPAQRVIDFVFCPDFFTLPLVHERLFLFADDGVFFDALSGEELGVRGWPYSYRDPFVATFQGRLFLYPDITDFAIDAEGERAFASTETSLSRYDIRGATTPSPDGSVLIGGNRYLAGLAIGPDRLVHVLSQDIPAQPDFHSFDAETFQRRGSQDVFGPEQRWFPYARRMRLSSDGKDALVVMSGDGIVRIIRTN